MNSLFYFSFCLGLFIMSSHPAQAYLDPGSGSLLFQLLVGGVLSGMFAIKLYYKKIKLFFKKLSSPKQGAKEDKMTGETKESGLSQGMKEEKENDKSEKN